jgi:hypothetical protein
MESGAGLKRFGEGSHFFYVPRLLERDDTIDPRF